MRTDNGYLELTAHLLDVLVRNDRKIRAIGPPRDRQEWGISRVHDYLRAIGRETIEEDGEEALWRLARDSVALLPAQREEAVHRLVRLWGPLGWLDDQDIPAPPKPLKYRRPVVEPEADRIAG
jgi:hypothetical protein